MVTGALKRTSKFQVIDSLIQKGAGMQPNLFIYRYDTKRQCFPSKYLDFYFSALPYPSYTRVRSIHTEGTQLRSNAFDTWQSGVAPVAGRSMCSVWSKVKLFMCSWSPWSQRYHPPQSRGSRSKFPLSSCSLYFLYIFSGLALPRPVVVHHCTRI